MKIEIENTDNAAFQDGNKEFETVRILKKIIDQIENGKTDGVCHDINGNRVGTWEL